MRGLIKRGMRLDRVHPVPHVIKLSAVPGNHVQTPETARALHWDLNNSFFRCHVRGIVSRCMHHFFGGERRMSLPNTTFLLCASLPPGAPYSVRAILQMLA